MEGPAGDTPADHVRVDAPCPKGLGNGIAVGPAAAEDRIVSESAPVRLFPYFQLFRDGIHFLREIREPGFFRELAGDQGTEPLVVVCTAIKVVDGHSGEHGDGTTADFFGGAVVDAQFGGTAFGLYSARGEDDLPAVDALVGVPDDEEGVGALGIHGVPRECGDKAHGRGAEILGFVDDDRRVGGSGIFPDETFGEDESFVEVDFLFPCEEKAVCLQDIPDNLFGGRGKTGALAGTGRGAAGAGGGRMGGEWA